MKILGSAAVDYPHEGLISTSLLFGARISDFEYGSNEREMINTISDELLFAKLTKV